MDPRALYVQYFVCGFAGEFPDISRYFYLKACGFAVDRIQMINAAVASAWFTSFAWGYASDVYQKRRAFVLLAQGVMALCWAALLTQPARPGFLNGAAFVVDEACVVAWATILDGALVAAVRERAVAPGVQFVCGSFYFAGRMAGAIAGGLVRDAWGDRGVFWTQMLVIAATTVPRMHEPAFARRDPAASALDRVFDAVHKTRWRLHFLVCFAAVPSVRDVVFFFLTNVRGFSAFDMGVVYATTFASVALASFAFSKFTVVPEHDMYVVVVLGVTLTFLGQLALLLRWNAQVGIPDLAMAMALPVQAALGTLAFSPYQGLLTHLAGEQHQATVYAVLGAIPFLGSALSYIASVELTRMFGVAHDAFGGAPALARVVVLVSVLPAVPLLFYGGDDDDDEANEADEARGG